MSQVVGHLCGKGRGWLSVLLVLLSACGGGGGGGGDVGPVDPPGPIVVENRPPVVVSNAITHATTNQLYQYDVEAIDPDTGDEIRYSLAEFPPSMTIDPVSGAIAWTPTSENIGDHPVTVVVSDSENATGTQSFTVSVAEQGSGVRITSAAVTNATQDQEYRYDVNAAGGETSVPYAFSLEIFPPGMTINTDSGLVAWKPSNANIGSHPVIIVVSDARGGSDRQSFTLTVANVNDPPEINWNPVKQAREHEKYEHTVTVIDPDANDTVTLSLTQAPTGMSIDGPTGQLGWTPTSADLGNHQVTIEARDAQGATDRLMFTLTVEDVNEPPVITSLPETAVIADRLFVYRVAASDPDAGDRVSFTLPQKPTGMQIDNEGLVTWVPTSSQTGARTVRVRVADSAGLAVEQKFVIDVINSISKSNWSLLFVDSENGSGNARSAFDGDSSTIWHTEWRDAQPKPPHEIQIDLGARYDIGGFRYLPRQDGNTNGRVKDYEFYASEDGTNWGLPVSIGSFENSKYQKEVLFPSVTARFIRFVALTEVSGTPFTSAAEIDLLGAAFSGNYRPNGIIESPGSDLVINPGDSIIFSGSSVDRDGDVPLATAWEFGSSAVPDEWSQNPGMITFSNPGTYVVTMKTMDATGRLDSTPAQRIIKVREPGTPALLDQSKWSVHFSDSEEITAVDGSAERAFDANVGTYWITDYTSVEPGGHPHEIQIDLGSAYALDGLRYLPRQDGQTQGNIADFRVFVSEDGVNWGNPVSVGSFSSDLAEKSILFPPTFGQYVRLVSRSEVGGSITAAAAEVNVEGLCQTPYVRILQPRDFHIQSDNILRVRSSVCLNPQLHSGWGIKFILDNNSSIVDTSPPFEAVFSSVSQGEHTIKAFVVDSQGTAIDGAHAYDEVISVGVGKFLVALGDSISFGVGDDDTSDDTSTDGRVTEGGYPPNLNDLLTAARGYPHAVSKNNSAVPGETSSGMLARMPSAIAANAAADAYLIELGTNDGNRAFPVPSGLGLTAGDAGYAGTFKDNMQKIIDSVRNAGAAPYLAKLPYANKGSTVDNAIQGYNSVIEELVVTNNITVTPPDFYNHFKSNPSHLSSDNLHPNGAGYKAMAQLWLNTLTN